MKGIEDLQADPFGEHASLLQHPPLQLLGARVHFESNHSGLLRLVDAAYAHLPAHHLGGRAPQLHIRLIRANDAARPARGEPEALQMHAGEGVLGAASGHSSCAWICPAQRSALLRFSTELLRHPYHARYELLEFALFTLASRVQQLVPLHGACVGLDGRGVLLLGDSGSGKSTLALHCLLQGFEFIAEDSVFIAAGSGRVSGIANYLHLQPDALRWLETKARRSLARAPRIRRRSGVSKLEIDLRAGAYRLASAPLRLAAIVLLSAQPAAARPPVTRLSDARLMRILARTQPYGAQRPCWPAFVELARTLPAYELRRAGHPHEGAQLLRQLLGRS